MRRRTFQAPGFRALVQAFIDGIPAKYRNWERVFDTFDNLYEFYWKWNTSKCKEVIAKRFNVYLDDDTTVKKPFIVITNPRDECGPNTPKAHAYRIAQAALDSLVAYSFVYLPNDCGSLHSIIDNAIGRLTGMCTKGKLNLNHKQDRNYFLDAAEEIEKALVRVVGLKEKLDPLALNEFETLKARAEEIRKKRLGNTYV